MNLSNGTAVAVNIHHDEQDGEQDQYVNEHAATVQSIYPNSGSRSTGVVASPSQPSDIALTDLSQPHTMGMGMGQNGSVTADGQQSVPHHMVGHMSSSFHWPNCPPAADATPVFNTTSWKTPKQTLLSVIKAGTAKSLLPLYQLILLGLNSGIFLAFGGACSLMVGGGFSGTASILQAGSTTPAETITMLAYLGRFMQGLVFPIGLVLIVLAGSELFTGNIMYLSCAWLGGKCSWRSVLKNWCVVWLFNFIGSVLVAYFLVYLPGLVDNDPFKSFVTNITYKKLHDGWGSMVLKGIGCNYLVCMALWCNLTCEDIISKIISLWLPISTFVWIGWEHSIANMFTIPLGLFHVIPGCNFGDSLAWNFIPVTLGNMIGGLMFAVGQFLIFGSYAKPSIEKMEVKAQKIKRQDSQTSAPLKSA